MARRARLPAVVLVAAVTLVALGCSGGSDDEAAASPTSAVPDGPIGELVPVGPRDHVDEGSLGPNEPLPSAGGPHYPTWVDPGIYDEPVPDGNAIHSMEHGMVWISYQPDEIDGDELTTLEAIAGDHASDVVLSPRLENSFAVIVESWGRRLVLDGVNDALIRAYIERYVDLSPEPGLR